MKLNIIIDNAIEEIAAWTHGAEEVPVEKLGLEPRAGYKVWIDREDKIIVVLKDRDSALQYYGGFSYGNKSCRLELGEYVIYRQEDEGTGELCERVAGCFEWLEGQSDEDDET